MSIACSASPHSSHISASASDSGRCLKQSRLLSPINTRTNANLRLHARTVSDHADPRRFAPGFSPNRSPSTRPLDYIYTLRALLWGLLQKFSPFFCELLLSHPARGGWIEVATSGSLRSRKACPSPQRTGWDAAGGKESPILGGMGWGVRGWTSVPGGCRSRL